MFSTLGGVSTRRVFAFACAAVAQPVSGEIQVSN